MEFYLKEIYQNIFLATFTDLYQLGMTLLRVQEFYESPNPQFRDKYFELETYMDYFVKTIGKGKFDYYLRYVGFNLSGLTIQKFLSLYRKKETILRSKEELFFKALLPLIPSEKLKQNYLIGIRQVNRENAYYHELSHALFYLDAEYQEESLKILSNIKPKDKLKVARFLQTDYWEGVFEDEMVAYLINLKPFKALLREALNRRTIAFSK
jgi:hypothetical protein